MLGRTRRAPEPAPDPDPGFLGIQFDCCDVYARIYRNEDRTYYEGRCPRCLRAVRVRIGKGGSNERFFRAS
ncbi:MAG: hypothetical protein HKN12_11360 [Gemmatimonadetes bacterium]|nr:hypothetical protein [Gemmatimonadota bacterium]